LQELSEAASGSAAAAPSETATPETAPPKPGPVSYGLPGDELPADVKRAKPHAPIKVKPVKAVPYDHVGMALTADENDIMTLLAIRHEEGGYGEFDDIKVRAVVRALTQRMGGVIGVIRGKKLIEASIALVLDYPWFSSTPILRDLWSFTHPRHRRTFHHRELLSLAQDYAAKLGVTLVMDAVGDVPVSENAFGITGLLIRQLGQRPKSAMFVIPAPERA
jgi:hypothetical protein